MASDSEAYLRQLRKRGYTTRRDGRDHIEVYWGGTLVTSESATRYGGRGLANFKARVKRFEENRPTLRIRKRT